MRLFFYVIGSIFDTWSGDTKAYFSARDLQAFLVFSQHPAWVTGITPVNP